MTTFKVDEVNETSAVVVLGEKLWLADDGSVVADGDPSAAVLIGPAGLRLSRPDALRYGLVKPTKDEQAAQDQADADLRSQAATATPVGEDPADSKQQDKPADKQRTKGGDK